MKPRSIKVEIVGDLAEFERALNRARFLVERSWWRRALLRVALWRAGRTR